MSMSFERNTNGLRMENEQIMNGIKHKKAILFNSQETGMFFGTYSTITTYMYVALCLLSFPNKLLKKVQEDGW